MLKQKLSFGPFSAFSIWEPEKKDCISKNGTQEVSKTVTSKKSWFFRTESRAVFYAKFSGANEKPILISILAPHMPDVRIKRHVWKSDEIVAKISDNARSLIRFHVSMLLASGLTFYKNRPHIHAPRNKWLPDAASWMATCAGPACTILAIVLVSARANHGSMCSGRAFIQKSPTHSSTRHMAALRCALPTPNVQNYGHCIDRRLRNGDREKWVNCWKFCNYAIQHNTGDTIRCSAID